MLTDAEARHMDAPTSGERGTDTGWVDVCAVEDVLPGTGVAALIRGDQIAIVRSPDGQSVFALSNFDPFSKAFVMSRGILGDRGGVLKIASPVYKQTFDVRTGQCLDDAGVRLPVYDTRVSAGRIAVRITAEDE